VILAYYKDALATLKDDYKHILIDCPPSLTLLTINALSAADLVLIPVQCQFFALKGLKALLKTIGSVQKRLNPELKILGVLPTMAEKNTVMTQDVLSSLHSSLPDIHIFDPVPKSVKFPESNVAGLPIHSYAADSRLIEPYGGNAEFGAIINVKPSGSTKLIVPTSLMFGSSLSRTQRGTSPTLFGNLDRSSHALVYAFISCQLAASQNIERCFKLVVATITC
jgi:AAA domain